MKLFKMLFGDREEPLDDCPFCGKFRCVRVVETRNMGGVVPYEWVRCGECGTEGWGARL